MKYTIISLAMLCLMFLESNNLNAQKTSIEVVSENGNIKIDSAINMLSSITHIDPSTRCVDESYTKFYKRADSLKEIHKALQISQSFKQTIEQLNNTEPYLFLAKAQNLYETNPSQADEIAILMYIGLMRFDYYTSVQPSYKNKTNKGWMVYEDFIQQNYKSRIELYLANSIEKYKEVLKYAIDYCNNKDFAFCNKPKEILIHKKVMLQYEFLYNDLINNKELLSKEWAANKTTKLKESSLQEVNGLDKNRNNNDALLSIIENLKLEKQKQDLWANIQVERVNLNSEILKQYVHDFIALENKIEAANLNRKKNNQQDFGSKTTSVLTKQDNSQSIYTNSKSQAKLDTANSKLDIYNYYDQHDNNSNQNAFIAKVNANILAYVNKMPWDEDKKLSVFTLLQYNTRSEPVLQIKTTYLANAEAITKPVEDFIGFNIYIKKAKRKQAMLMYILGEVEGILVSEDVKIMNYNLKQQAFPNSY